MALADFARPVVTAVSTTFLTPRAAARHMIRRGSGVILVFGGEGDPMRDHYLGGLQVAFHAPEAMRRQLASELGPRGIRVVTLQTGGVPESIPEGFPRARRSPRRSSARRCCAGRRRSRTSATWPPSSPRTAGAP
jgi:3-oxoacyl-[acyl-carrier protein] reductase